jgi:hypothetical protein
VEIDQQRPRLAAEFAFAERRSFVEQVGMGARAHEVQLVTGDAIDRQPVRLDVGVTIALPVALQRMVLVPFRQTIAGQ